MTLQEQPHPCRYAPDGSWSRTMARMWTFLRGKDPWALPWVETWLWDWSALLDAQISWDWAQRHPVKDAHSTAVCWTQNCLPCPYTLKAAPLSPPIPPALIIWKRFRGHMTRKWRHAQPAGAHVARQRNQMAGITADFWAGVSL